MTPGGVVSTFASGGGLNGVYGVAYAIVPVPASTGSRDASRSASRSNPPGQSDQHYDRNHHASGCSPGSQLSEARSAPDPDGAGLVELEYAGFSRREDRFGIGDFFAAPLDAPSFDQAAGIGTRPG